MEGQGDHRLHLGQIYQYGTVVVRHVCRRELLVSLRPAVDLEVPLRLLVCGPDGGQTGGFRCHHVDTVAEFNRQICNPVSYKFQHFIFHKFLREYCANDGQRHILRTYARAGRAGEIDGNYLRHVHIVGAVQNLLHQLGAAFSDGHGSQGAVAGVAVAAQNHLAAAAHHLPHKGVNDRLVGGNVYGAVFFCGGQAEHVVVLVDGAAHSAQAVVAVGEHIWQGQLFQAAGTGGHQNAHVCNIMRSQGVKTDFQMHVICAYIVICENCMGDGALPASGRVASFGDKAVVRKEYAVFNQLNHRKPPKCRSLRQNTIIKRILSLYTINSEKSTGSPDKIPPCKKLPIYLEELTNMKKRPEDCRQNWEAMV